MNFSPDNSQGLLGLVQALKAGMDPNTAYSLVTDIQNNQAASIAARQQRLSGLADLLSGQAAQGMSYEGAQALAEAQPGPAGPAIQQMLASLYPTADVQAGTQEAIQATQQGYDPQAEALGMSRPAWGPQAQSPTYTPDYGAAAQDQLSQVQLQQGQLELQAQMNQLAAQSDPAWTVLQADASKAKAKGWTPDQFVANFGAFSPDHAALLQSDPDRVAAILSNTFGAQAVKYAGQTQTAG